MYKFTNGLLPSAFKDTFADSLTYIRTTQEHQCNVM